MRFKLERGSLIVGSEFTVFALFYVVFEGSFSKYKPLGDLYLKGPFNGGFFALPVWGAYTWRGLFSEFYGICCELLLDILKISSENWDFGKYFLVRNCLRSLRRAKKSRQNAKFLMGSACTCETIA